MLKNLNRILYKGTATPAQFHIFNSSVYIYELHRHSPPCAIIKSLKFINPTRRRTGIYYIYRIMPRASARLSKRRGRNKVRRIKKKWRIGVLLVFFSQRRDIPRATSYFTRLITLERRAAFLNALAPRDFESSSSRAARQLYEISSELLFRLGLSYARKSSSSERGVIFSRARNSRA